LNVVPNNYVLTANILVSRMI